MAEAFSIPAKPSTVFIVDDDAEVRKSLRLLMESVQLDVLSFASAEAFLAAYSPARPGCLVTDVRMPGMSGLDLQRHLAEQKISIPVIIITAHGEIPMAVDAVKAGALDFIPKPFSPHKLLERVREAIALDAEMRKELAEQAGTDVRLKSLSPREREVMNLLLAGQSAKKIASLLGLSVKTVDFHRRNLLSKMAVENILELARLMPEGK